MQAAAIEGKKEKACLDRFALAALREAGGDIDKAKAFLVCNKHWTKREAVQELRACLRQGQAHG